MKRSIILTILLCLTVTLLVSACAGKKSPEPDSSPSASTSDVLANTTEPPSGTQEPGNTETNAPSGGTASSPTASSTGTVKPGEDTAAPETEDPDKTAEATGSAGTAGQTSSSTNTSAGNTSAATPTPTPDVEGPLSAAHVKFSDKAASGIFTGPNATKYEVLKDAKDGWVAKISTTGASNDPYISFNYNAFIQKYKLTAVNAQDYPYVLFRVKVENCSNSTFELFYTTSGSPGISGTNSVFTIFDNASSGWQYIIFDCTRSANWKTAVRTFRLDYMQTSAAAGETMYISDVIFAKSLAEAREIAGYSSTGTSGVTDAEQKKANDLLAKAKEVAPSVSNTKVNAANEDSSINLWFDHTYTKTAAETTKSTGMYTYQMRLAKNEIEACQFLLSSTSNKTGLTAQLSDFKDSKGNTLRAEIFYGYYFSNVQGKTIADPIPPLTGSFDLTANKSKIFLIKVYSTASTPAGQYSATLTIKNSAGQEVKKANVYAYVWDFTLPDETSCKTLSDLSWHNIYANYGSALDSKYFDGDDGVLYAKYYEYLLENRINAYTLPYNSNDLFSDSRVVKYLNNPRVRAFALGWHKDARPLTDWRTAASYNYLKQNAEWLKKAYYYVVDEPVYSRTEASQQLLDDVIAAGKLLKENFPGYKLIVPMHLNSALKTDGSLDYFEYVKDYVNTWCPHTFFFNSFEEYRANPLLTYRATTMIESKLGTFADRMAKEQKGGDEVWWYVTRFPSSPEITLTMETQAVKYRILFWQQKLYNVDGFLYYLSNDWYGVQDGDPKWNYGWNAKHETKTGGIDPYDVYGNGVLIYSGAVIGIEEPVGSLRLECVRDGIEDFEYLTMLDKLYGEGTADLVIRQLTTSLGEYKADEEFFTKLRIQVGNLIAAK